MRTPNPTKREGPAQVPRPGRAPPATERFEPKEGLVVAGKYRVERVIGEGGMGVVVAATHVELDQHVAIKFLLPEAMRHEIVVERFMREAKVAARVNSEYVARVTDVGKVEPSGTPFIVMEYLEGSDLGAMIDSSGRLALDEASEIGLQACEALAEVHAAGIVHRDLKPSNLFVTRRADGSPCVKLLDFGISKLNMDPDEPGVDPALTATATIMGSPSYMSPEQLRSTKEVDGRTDVWALGAVLYEAMTGKPAFRGETVPQVCFMIGSEDPPPPSSLRADIPAELERVILSCLDKNGATRATLVDLARVLVETAPPRARASLERLEAVVGAAPSLSKGVSLAGPSRPGFENARTQSSWGDDRGRKRGGAVPLVALALVAVGVFGVGVYTGRIDLRSMRAPMKSAASVVGSVVASATAAVESAIPSTFPVPSFPVPSGEVWPAPGASEGADDEDDVPADSSSSLPTGSVAPHYATPPHKNAPRTKHYVNKTVHRKHY